MGLMVCWAGPQVQGMGIEQWGILGGLIDFSN
jgi:hypothetical protein